jgi:thioredoxin reductase (NADPH)
VVGAGFAGLSAAIWSRRLGLSVLVLETSSDPGGQLWAIAQPIIDYPGVTGASGTELARRLREQAEQAGAVLHSGAPVVAIGVAARECRTATGDHTGRALVLATGLTRRQVQVPGESELGARHLVRRPSRDLPWFAGKRVAVIGGGDRALENAILLAPVAERVFLIHRGAALSGRDLFQRQVAAARTVELRLGAMVTGFRFPGAGQADVLLAGGAIGVDAVCIYIGNRPNTDVVAGQLDLTPDGYIIIDRWGQSSAPGVYAAGDVCTAPAFQSLATAAGQAMAVAKQIALRLREP